MKILKYLVCLTAVVLATFAFGSGARAQDEEADPCIAACWKTAEECHETCGVEDEECEQACDVQAGDCEMACE